MNYVSLVTVLPITDLFAALKAPVEYDFEIKAQSYDSFLALTDSKHLFITEILDEHVEAWTCVDGDLICSISWFDVTPKLSVLMVGFESGRIRCFDKVCLCETVSGLKF